MSTRSRGRRLATGAIVGIAIACAIVVILCLLCCYCCCFRKRRQNKRAAPVAHGHAAPPPRRGGLMGKFNQFMPGRGGHPAGPGMTESGYGAGPGYGGPNVQRPPPTYR